MIQRYDISAYCCRCGSAEGSNAVVVDYDPDKAGEWVKYEDIKEYIMEEQDFSWALKQAKQGKKIQRSGWNGKGLVVKAQYPDGNSKMNLAYLYIEYPDGKRCPWLASQTDIMSDDWNVVE